MNKPGELENRVTGAEKVTEALRSMKATAPADEDELTRLRARIDRARGLMAPRGACCGHCFGNGVAATLRVIDDGA